MRLLLRIVSEVDLIATTPTILSDTKKDKERERNKRRVHQKYLWKIRARIPKKRLQIKELERILYEEINAYRVTEGEDS
jgi:hypothetical protein